MPDAGRRLLCLPQHHGHRPRLRIVGEELLEKAHVAVLPGESFGRNGKGYLRLSYAASEADIREALRRMARFCIKGTMPGVGRRGADSTVTPRHGRAGGVMQGLESLLNASLRLHHCPFHMTTI
jgi:hypothetical protein